LPGAADVAGPNRFGEQAVVADAVTAFTKRMFFNQM
jgi:hypothetical protein